MYQKSNNYSQSSNRPYRRGGFSNSRFSGNRGGSRFGNQRRPVSRLTHNTGIFIKKADLSLPNKAFTPANSFADFNLHRLVKENIAARGYSEPTPIQDQAIAPIIEGRDLIGLAGTGTGKTGAFLIPIINKIFIERTHKALIIAPTRELAQQIREEFYKLTEGMKIYSTLVIGGANMNRQIWDLRRNPHVVIGTPGRLKDLVQQKYIVVADYDTFVLDEVDLMVDIGFIADIKFFLGLLPKVRQSLFFSATISPKIREILQSFVNDPVTVSIKKADATSNIDQDVVRIVDRSKKIDQLHDLLIKDDFKKVLIFGRTKHEVEKLHKELEIRGFKTGAIHGNKTQGHRQRILQSFKQSDIQILLATDVASRGLDIENVTHVINYDLPETYDDYIHRIGRTGRAGNKGTALTFIDG